MGNPPASSSPRYKAPSGCKVSGELRSRASRRKVRQPPWANHRPKLQAKPRILLLYFYWEESPGRRGRGDNFFPTRNRAQL